MKQIIPFKKDLVFDSFISEITSISLEHTLHLADGIVTGEFIIGGQYKISDVSITPTDFYFSVPFDIAVDDDYDLTSVKIDIEDFYYEIIKDNTLQINIEVGIDGLKAKEVKTPESVIEEVETLKIPKESGTEEDRLINDVEGEIIKEAEGNREVEGESIAVETDETFKRDSEQDSVITKEQIRTVFDSFDDSAETFATYFVYIVRENDTLEAILQKYNVTKEALGDYNDLEDIKIGTKLIIPASTNYE